MLPNGTPIFLLTNLDSNFRHLDLGEREFFGLMFNDSGADHVPVGHSPDVMRWLDPTKLIRKQVRVNGVQKTNVTPVATLYFRVKFYVTDPSRLSTCSSHVLTNSETTNHEILVLLLVKKLLNKKSCLLRPKDHHSMKGYPI